jgi:futalosine hydrolase
MTAGDGLSYSTPSSLYCHEPRKYEYDRGYDMIALLCSVHAEAEHILAWTTVKATTQLGSKSIIAGTLAGREVLICVGGMGKVNAAHAATILIADFAPEALVVFGVGGAYPSSGAAVGDVVLAHQEIAGDEGVLTHDGFMDTEYIGIPLIKTASSVIFTTYPAPEHLLKRALHTLITTAKPGSGKVHFGSFVTLSTCTGTSARAAALHTIPWLEVRGISNIVEDRNLKKWDIPLAAEAAQRAVVSILKGW